MPVNKKREAYIILLTAAQKQLPQEVNLVVEEHFIPNCPSDKKGDTNVINNREQV